jgi:UDP-glucose 4-epimerase
MSKSFLVTGGAGFIGSHLCNKFSFKNNFDVIGIYGKKKKERSKLLDNTIKIKLNLFNYNKLETIIKKLKPDILIHTSWIGVSKKYSNSEIQKKNGIIIDNILKLKKLNIIKHYLFFGSQIEYKRSLKKITERHKLEVTSLYSAEKIKSYNKIKKKINNFTWLRLFDVFGNYDSKKWIIPKIISAVRDRKIFKIKQPYIYWDFLFIDELTEIIRLIVVKKIYGVYNLCSGKKIKLISIAKIIDKTNSYITYNKNYKKNYNLIGDNAKILKKINYRIKSGYKKNLIYLYKDAQFL